MSDSGTRDTSLAAGHRLDGYELLWPVGEGGMAQVWVARLTRKHGFEKLVAIKTILPKFAEDEAFQTMFLDEARIASRIDHTNVAHIHDLGEKDDILYLVMEYVDGDALTRLRKVLVKKKAEFPIGIALRIMSDVCAGLHAAHELKGPDGSPLGVVHRDVSPQNILVTTDGISKVIDFGVAKAAGRLTAETHTGYVKGKVQYMAPEQALGKNVDRRADIWAVGAVLYHLIANRPPFEAENQLALLALLQRGRPPAPLPSSVPAQVQELVKKALTHNAPLRFGSAAEMRSVIEKTGLCATSEEVAAFVREHLGELSQRRRDAITQAIQSLESSAAPPPVHVPAHTSPADSTQRIDPADLPRIPSSAPNQVAGRPPPGPPPSVSRIGPPTPQSFPAMPVRSTTAMAAVGLPSVPSSNPRIHAPTGPHIPPPSQPTFTAAAMVPPGSTEPLPVEALEIALDNTSSGTGTTNHGSLGLASISATVNAPPPRTVPWIPIGIGAGLGVMLLAGLIGIGLSNRGGAKIDTQFSPLPSAASALPPAAPSPIPSPQHTDEITPPPPPPEPAAAPAPAPSPGNTFTRPATSVVAPRPFPAPATSGKKKPRVDDGF